VLGDEIVVEAVEAGLVFSGEDDLPAGQAMFQAVHAGNGLAGLGARACRCMAAVLHFVLKIKTPLERAAL
jgi:hypothetical protein